MRPRVSVLIPAFNCAPYIGEAIESVLGQTYKDVEVVIVDDGSTDDTWKVVARYRGLVTAIRQDRRGVSAARNEALRRARGEFIALLDADDVYLPEKLELQVQALDRYPEAGLVFTDLVEFTDAGKILGRGLLGTPFFRQWLRAHRRGSVSVGWMYRETLIQMCVPGGSCAMIRRECLDAVGDYHPALRRDAHCASTTHRRNRRAAGHFEPNLQTFPFSSRLPSSRRSKPTAISFWSQRRSPCSSPHCFRSHGFAPCPTTGRRARRTSSPRARTRRRVRRGRYEPR